MAPREHMEKLRRLMLAIAAMYNDDSADSDYTLDIRVVRKSQELPKRKRVA